MIIQKCTIVVLKHNAELTIREKLSDRMIIYNSYLIFLKGVLCLWDTHMVLIHSALKYEATEIPSFTMISPHVGERDQMPMVLFLHACQHAQVFFSAFTGLVFGNTSVF